MSLEELQHLRMAHTPIKKLAQLNGKVSGLPRHLQFPKVLNLPRACCREAKAIRQPDPPASEKTCENEDDMITWDLFDMGEEWKTIDGN